MFLKWKLVLTLSALLLANIGCQLTAKTTPAPIGSTSNPDTLIPFTQSSTAEGRTAPSGSVAGWPAYIPPEIPPFEGQIRKVMGGEAGTGRIRIFYENVTLDQVKAYLSILESQGFHLEYQVYVDISKGDNAEERMKKGDYDAVDITKGDYHMNIAYGAGNITYDIYTNAFASAIPTEAGLPWPAELVGVVPQPERCLVNDLNYESPGAYIVQCDPEDNQVLGDYLSALGAAGYAPTELASTSNTVYGKGSWGVTANQYSDATLEINILPIGITSLQWPARLLPLVPPPQDCPPTNITELGGNNYMISCQAEDDQMVPNYRVLLVSLGFTETDKIESTTGELLALTFEKGGLKVQVFISAMDPKNITLQVTE